jgi:cardiolipin synthase
VTIADRLSIMRLLLVALMWPAALAGEGRLVGIGMLVAGLTDALDGYLARRLGVASARGARLDAVADAALLISSAAWLSLLQPRVLTDNSIVLLGTAVIYAASTATNWFAYGRLVDPRQLTAKLAGGLLYAFALITLMTGIYEPLLLTVAVAALAIACVESLLKASMTIHARAITSKARSQSPHPSNGVASSAAASASINTSTSPATRQSSP